jgi:hypothetical protein
MSNPATPLSPSEALRLHQRLLEEDPTASHDLVDAFLEPLSAWLTQTNRRAPHEFCEEAAGAALVALIHNPRSFSPDLQSLDAYLRMSAQGDLKNLLARERKHFQGRVPWERVEHLPDPGKYLGRADDPAWPLLAAEQLRQADDAVPPAVWEGLSDTEKEGLRLLLRKERKTAVYARACGFAHLPLAEQRKAVKRLKDRLTKRLQRAGGTHDRAPGPAGPAGDD